MEEDKKFDWDKERGASIAKKKSIEYYSEYGNSCPSCIENKDEELLISLHNMWDSLEFLKWHLNSIHDDDIEAHKHTYGNWGDKSNFRKTYCCRICPKKVLDIHLLSKEKYIEHVKSNEHKNQINKYIKKKEFYKRERKMLELYSEINKKYGDKNKYDCNGEDLLYKELFRYFNLAEYYTGKKKEEDE